MSFQVISGLIKIKIKVHSRERSVRRVTVVVMMIVVTVVLIDGLIGVVRIFIRITSHIIPRIVFGIVSVTPIRFRGVFKE